jgi:hypothetical protein
MSFAALRARCWGTNDEAQLSQNTRTSFVFFSTTCRCGAAIRHGPTPKVCQIGRHCPFAGASVISRVRRRCWGDGIVPRTPTFRLRREMQKRNAKDQVEACRSAAALALCSTTGPPNTDGLYSSSPTRAVGNSSSWTRRER